MIHILYVWLNRNRSSWERVFSETTIVVNQPTSLRHGRALLLWRKEDSTCLVAMPVENTRSQLEGFGETGGIAEELRRRVRTHTRGAQCGRRSVVHVHRGASGHGREDRVVTGRL